VSTIKLSRLPSRAELDQILAVAMKAVAIEATKIIKERTAKGVDVHGGDFAPYSAKYAREKGGSGRNTSPVDMTVTGALLNDLKLLRVVDSTHAIIGWEGQHRQYQFKPLAQPRKLRDGSMQTYTEVSTAKTVSYLDLVTGLTEKKGEFFGIEAADELARLATVLEDEIMKGLAALK